MNAPLSQSTVIDRLITTLAPYNQAGLPKPHATDDIFAIYGMTSLDIFRAIAQIEKSFGIEIGERPEEFEMIRTLGGLEQLVAEKLRTLDG